MERLLSHVTSTITSEKGYSALFRAGIVLLGAAMIALSQTGTFLYERDLEAHRAKYEVQAVTGAVVDSRTKCEDVPAEVRAKCFTATHELRTLDSSLGLFSSVVQTCLWIGVVLSGLAVVGFVCSPFVRSPA